MLTGDRACPGSPREGPARGARGRALWTHVGKPGSRTLLRADCRGFDQAGAALFAQPVAVAADGDHLAVVKQSVEDRGRHHRIPSTVPHSPTERLEVISVLPRS